MEKRKLVGGCGGPVLRAGRRSQHRGEEARLGAEGENALRKGRW